jgi:hypothetical protein
VGEQDFLEADSGNSVPGGIFGGPGFDRFCAIAREWYFWELNAAEVLLLISNLKNALALKLIVTMGGIFCDGLLS